jgi:Ni/Fe-hydrogenase 1 B-type cytochrome subunit
MTMERVQLDRVYVWEVPVRLYHWVNAACIVALVATGFLIGAPIGVAATGEAYGSYAFAWVRFIHFVAAFVFFFNFVARIYWGFVGNEYARWHNFLPLGRQRFVDQINEAIDVVRLELVQARTRPIPSVGHNSLAGWTYFASFLAFLFQSVTGFGMYAAMSDAWFPQLFAWVVPLMGGDASVRLWHHAMMWFFVVFTIVHVYLVAYHDYMEGRGIISSMTSGWKFVERRQP